MNSGGVEVYDLKNNQITNAAFMGTVGLNWQFSGVGNFSGVPGETDLLLRNSTTGGLAAAEQETLRTADITTSLTVASFTAMELTPMSSSVALSTLAQVRA